MDILLEIIQNFYDHFPFSLKVVVILTAVFVISFSLIFREFWAWYTKVSALRKELVAMRAQLNRIEEALQENRQMGGNTEEGAGNGHTLTLSVPEPQKKNAFPLTH
jgi:hypothetical protein